MHELYRLSVLSVYFRNVLLVEYLTIHVIYIAWHQNEVGNNVQYFSSFTEYRKYKKDPKFEYYNVFN